MDIKEVKSRYPMLAGMDDADAVKAFHQHFYPDFSEEEVAKRLGVDMRPKVPDAPVPDEGRTVLGTAKDIGITALKGAMAVPEAAVGLLDIPTGGRVGKALEDVGLRFKDANAMLDDSYSPAQKKANKAVSDADGVGGKFVAALQNPSTIAHAIGQSVPSMLAGGLVGRGVAALAPRIGAVGAAAAGEGITAAGSSAEQIRQGTEDGVLTAGQSGIAALSGAATGAFGLLGGKVAKSLGIADLDTAIVRASAEPAIAKSLLRRTLEGALAEGVLEELPQSISEQVLQNYALGKPLEEGVDQAAVMGLLSGAAMGGGMNALHGTPKAAPEPQGGAAAPAGPAVPLLGYAGTDPQAIQVDAQGNASTWNDRENGAPTAARGFNDVTAVPPEAATVGGQPLALPAPTVTVGPDGQAYTAEDRNDRLQRIAAGDVITEVGQPVQKPQGPLARAAAKAMPQDIIDVPAVTVPQQEAMFPADAVAAPVSQPGAVDEHGVIDSPDNTPGIADWSDEQLRSQLQSAQAPEVRRALYEEIGQRDVESEQNALRDELDAEQSAVANTQADDAAFAKLHVDDATDAPQPADLLNAEGKPFTIRGAAARAGAKAGNGYEPVKIKGGWVARKTAAMDAATPGESNGAQAAEVKQTGTQPSQAPGATGEAQGNTAAPRKGDIGMKLGAGEVVLTSSGRQTTAFPKVATDTNRKALNTIKAADSWLMQNALDEARSRGDDFNARQFEASLTKPQQADKDSAEQYLFGDQPEVVPSSLKPLSATASAAEPVAATQTAAPVNQPSKPQEEARVPETKASEPGSSFPLQEASASYAGISHSGNSRAKADADEFQSYLDAARADGAEVARTDAQKAAVEQAMDSLRNDYLQHYGRLMGVRASTYSGFVAGRSGLNSNQADKRNGAYDKAIDNFVSWQKANRARVRQAALDARTEDEKAADRQAVEQAKADKAQRKEDSDRSLMRKILTWKKGEDPVSISKAANLAGVNLGRDGYPTSIKLVPTDGTVLTDDKFNLASLFRTQGMSVEESKNRVRELVDAVRAEDAESNDPAPAAPAVAQSASKTPTLDAHVALLNRVRAGEATAEEFKAGFAAAEAGHDAMIAELGSMTKEQLLKSGGYSFYHRYKSEKKGDIVAALGSRVLDEYALGRSYGPSSYVMSATGLAAHRKAQDAAGDAGPAMSRGEAQEGQAPEVKRVQAQIDAIKARWPNAPEVVVAPHMQHELIPDLVRQADEAQRSAGAEGAPEGFFYKGKVYLVASELRTPKDVTRVLFHEALGHYGLRGVFGSNLASILNRVAVQKRADVIAKAREYGLVADGVNVETASDAQVWQSMSQQQRQYAAEEVLAVMAQEAPGQPWVQRAIAAVRSWLRENIPAFRQLRLTDAEIIRDYIVPARRFVTGSPEGQLSVAAAPGGPAEVPMYSRAPSAMRDLRSQVGEALNTRFNHPGTLSWWHKTIGTMYNLAEQSPDFKKVYQSAQAYIDDISQYALDAADHAPNLVPRLEDWRDAVPGLSKKHPISTEDAAAIAAPIFEGTLDWVRDLSGKPMRLDDATKEAEGLDVEQKASRMMKAGTIDPGMLKAWRGLPIAQFEKLVATRFASKHLTGGIVWSDSELRSQFKLNDKQVALYQEYRAAIDRSLDTTTRSDIVRMGGTLLAPVRDMIMDAANIGDAMMAIDAFAKQAVADDTSKADSYADVLQQVKNRADRLAELQARGYAPLQRFGEFTVHIAGEKEGDPSRYFGMFETKQEANAMAAKLRKEFGSAVVQGTLSKEEHKLLAGITPESLEIFGDMLGLAEAENGADQVYQEFLRKAKSDQSALKRMIHRQGIAGFSEDVGRGLASFIYSNARMTSGGLHIGDIGKAVADIPKSQGQMRDAAERLRQHVLEPQEKGAGVRAFMFAQYLGGSLASAAVNLTQPLTTSLPYLSQYGGAAKAGQALVQASIDMANRGKAYGKDLADALERAEKAGVVSPQEIHYLMGQARGSASLRSGDGTKAGELNAMRHNAWQRTKLLWGTAFGWAEQVNRRMTFIAAYRLAKENKVENPYAFAAKAVDETQFVQNKANKMEWGRGAVGGTLMTFKGFSIAYLELMYRMWNAGEPGSRERADGRKAVMIALGTLMLFGGGGGLPFLEDAEDIATGFGQMLGFNWNAKKARQAFLERTFGRELAQFMDKGLSGVPGVPIDVSGRLGMGNLIPGTGLLQEKTSYTRDYMELLGPAGDFVSRVAEGGKQVLGGAVTGDGAKVMRGAMQMAPKAVSNLEKGIDMGASGHYKDTRGGKVSDVTAAEAIMKAIGFQPSSVADIQEGNYLRQQAKNFYNMKAQEIRAMWAKGIAENDQDTIARARAALQDWNTKNPDQPMVANLPAIIKKAREMQRDKADRIAATAPKAMRTQMKREIQEAKGGLLQ